MSTTVRPYQFVKKCFSVACWLFLILLVIVSLLLYLVSQHSSIVASGLNYFQPDVQKINYQPFHFSKKTNTWVVSIPSFSIEALDYEAQAKSIAVNFEPWHLWPQSVAVDSLELVLKTNGAPSEGRPANPIELQSYLRKLQDIEPIHFTIEQLKVRQGQNSVQSKIVWWHEKKERLSASGRAMVPELSSEPLDFSSNFALNWHKEKALVAAEVKLADILNFELSGALGQPAVRNNVAVEESTKADNSGANPVVGRQKEERLRDESVGAAKPRKEEPGKKEPRKEGPEKEGSKKEEPVNEVWNFSWQASWSNQALLAIYQASQNEHLGAEFSGDRLTAEGTFSVSQHFEPRSWHGQLKPFAHQSLRVAAVNREFGVAFSMPYSTQLYWNGDGSYLKFQEFSVKTFESVLGVHALTFESNKPCLVSLCEFSVEGQSEKIVLAELSRVFNLPVDIKGKINTVNWGGQVSLRELKQATLRLDQINSSIEALQLPTARLASVDVSVEGVQVEAAFAVAEPEIKLSAPVVRLVGRTARHTDDAKVAGVDLRVKELNAKLAGGLSANLSWELRLDEIKTEVLAMAGAEITGKLQLTERQAKFSGRLLTDLAAPVLDFSGLHNFVGGPNAVNRGKLKWAWQLSPFSKESSLASRFGRWPLGGDVLAGEINGGGEIGWQLTPELSWQASGELALAAVSGVFTEIGFVGLDFDQQWTITSVKPLLSKGSLGMSSLDIGLPIDDIELNLELSNFDSLTIRNFKSQLLGGQLSSSKLQLAYTDQGLQSIGSNVIKVSELKLESLLQAADYAGLDATANVSGELPFEIHSGQLHLENGTLAAIEPGYIRYAGLADSGNPLMEVVSQALDNYHYEKLTADVKYDDKGYLDLTVALRGQNPDFQNGRQVNLNLNISDNIPNLIKSLQAGRLITDVISEKLEQ